MKSKWNSTPSFLGGWKVGWTAGYWNPHPPPTQGEQKASHRTSTASSSAGAAPFRSEKMQAYRCWVRQEESCVQWFSVSVSVFLLSRLNFSNFWGEAKRGRGIQKGDCGVLITSKIIDSSKSGRLFNLTRYYKISWLGMDQRSKSIELENTRGKETGISWSQIYLDIHIYIY